MECYTGSDFSLELSALYAEDLTTTYMAMFYGIGMPIMFPMAAIILAN